MITEANQIEQMKKQIHKLKDELKQATTVLKAYDGSHALDQWDENLMPSRLWVKSRNEFLKPKPKL